MKLFSEHPRVEILTIPPFIKSLVFSINSTLLRTELILTLIISSWSKLDLPYVKVLTPTVDASDMFPVTFVIPKNWVRDFDVYDTTPVVVSV